MIKKLLSTKGSSTLTIAILMIIIFSSLTIVTTLIIGTNAQISNEDVHKKYNTMLLENALYDEINYICLNNEEIKLREIESGSSYYVSAEVDDTNNNIGVIEITDGKYKVIATVEFDFTNDSYKILKWGRENA